MTYDKYTQLGENISRSSVTPLVHNIVEVNEVVNNTIANPKLPPTDTWVIGLFIIFGFVLLGLLFFFTKYKGTSDI